jgi:hypothetical protein
MEKRLLRWVGGLLAVSGLGLLVLAVLGFRETAAAVRDGRQVEGRVVTLEPVVVGGGVSSKLFRPLVEFRTQAGRPHTFLGPQFRPRQWFQLQWDARQGQLVRVLYDPRDIGTARIASARLLWGPSVLLFIGSAVLVALGIAASRARVSLVKQA